MIVGICWGSMLVAINFIWPLVEEKIENKEAFTLAAPLMIYTLCLVVLVFNIERISELLRLEREVARIKEEHGKVEVVKDQMKVFWGNVQDLTDLWLFRTIPRLDLFKELQAHIGDCEANQMMPQLKTVNSRLQTLESNVGSLQEWRSNAHKEGQNTEHKKLTQGVNRVIRSSHTSSMEELMKHLDVELAEGELAKIDHAAIAAAAAASGALAAHHSGHALEDDQSDHRYDFGPSLMTLWCKCVVCGKNTRNRGHKESGEIYCAPCYNERYPPMASVTEMATAK